MTDGVHVFGIRHHGPGSARSLLAELKALAPDCVLVEGPPDADALVAATADPRMKPPVAILVYATEMPRLAAFYPLAEFSPEWQAMRYAVAKGVELKFIDLPPGYEFSARMPEMITKTPSDAGDIATQADVPSRKQTVAADESLSDPAPSGTAEESESPAVMSDPVQFLAQAAGYGDGELWWEHMVETRRDSSGIFHAIMEAMTVLRRELPPSEDPWLERREAYMRKMIREAKKEGRKKIAVVCGAWHAPALAELPAAALDQQILSGLKRMKTIAAWVPWTNSRLNVVSGYGAGVRSPGWYEHVWSHLWSHPRQMTGRWFTSAARLLRKQDIDTSSADVIESVRLAETLAALRGISQPGLVEVTDAVEAVLCRGNSALLAVIHDKLVVGRALGKIPDNVAVTPLQQDLRRLQKRLRLPAKAGAEALELDLRKHNDRERSEMLHRLLMLDIQWGTLRSARSKGTFKEAWELRWEPELEVRLIEAGVWGNTVLDAAVGFARRLAMGAGELPALTSLLDRALHANLADAIGFLMRRVEAVAAVAADVQHMMAAIVPLAQIIRYGNVRQTDNTMVRGVFDGLLARIIIGLPTACAALNDDAARTMELAVNGVHDAVLLLENPGQTAQWKQLLARLAEQHAVHGLLAGRCARLAMDSGQMDAAVAGRLMSMALSQGNAADYSAAWIEGFIRGSGLVLLHDDRILRLMDNWIAQLDSDVFLQTLPLLRRTFAYFAPAERLQLANKVKAGSHIEAVSTVQPVELNHMRAAGVVGVLELILLKKTEEVTL